jgi:hypothetical protein
MSAYFWRTKATGIEKIQQYPYLLGIDLVVYKGDGDQIMLYMKYPPHKHIHPYFLLPLYLTFTLMSFILVFKLYGIYS